MIPFGRLRARVRPHARRLVTWPWVTRLAFRAFAGSARVRSDERTWAGRVSSRIACDDAMFRGDFGHYFSVGLSGIRCLEEALRASGAPDPATILDLPSGHGRVLRWLRARFPRAGITACEIDEAALTFCANELGARAVRSRSSFRDLVLPASFELVWCGSLLTHLPEPEAIDLLGCLARHLLPGGILVFSTHGELVAGRVRKDPASYRLDGAELPRILESWCEKGHSYWDLPGRTGYGVAIASAAWVRARVAGLPIPLQEVGFHPEGWDAHQDVFAFRRAPSTGPAAPGREGGG